MASWFCRRSGSRVSIRNPVRLRVLLQHQVSRETLCPLGQPEKAIGHESPIEPWLALHNRAACCVRNRRTSLRERHESAEKETPQSLVPLLGLDGKTISPVPYRRRGSICLDIPFYRAMFIAALAAPAPARPGKPYRGRPELQQNDKRIIKGRPFAVGFDRSHQRLQEGAPS